MLNINLQARFHLFWVDCRTRSVADTIRPLQERNISAVNIGFLLASFLKNKPAGKFFQLEVEEFLQRELEYTAKAVDASGVQVVAVYNLGILFEPGLALDPARFLKELSKRIGIILLWENKFEQPARFYWDDRQGHIHLDFTDADIKPITINP